MSSIDETLPVADPSTDEDVAADLKQESLDETLPAHKPEGHEKILWNCSNVPADPDPQPNDSVRESINNFIAKTWPINNRVCIPEVILEKLGDHYEAVINDSADTKHRKFLLHHDHLGAETPAAAWNFLEDRLNAKLSIKCYDSTRKRPSIFDFTEIKELVDRIKYLVWLQWRPGETCIPEIAVEFSKRDPKKCKARVRNRHDQANLFPFEGKPHDSRHMVLKHLLKQLEKTASNKGLIESRELPPAAKSSVKGKAKAEKPQKETKRNVIIRHKGDKANSNKYEFRNKNATSNS